jgi:hypothetical protein
MRIFKAQDERTSTAEAQVRAPSEKLDVSLVEEGETVHVIIGLLFLLLWLWLGGLSGSGGSASSTSVGDSGTAGDSSELLFASLNDFGEGLLGKLGDDLVELGVIDGHTDGGHDLLEISSGGLLVSTESSEQVSSNVAHL